MEGILGSILVQRLYVPTQRPLRYMTTRRDLLDITIYLVHCSCGPVAKLAMPSMVLLRLCKTYAVEISLPLFSPLELAIIRNLSFCGQAGEVEASWYFSSGGRISILQPWSLQVRTISFASRQQFEHSCERLSVPYSALANNVTDSSKHARLYIITSLCQQQQMRPAQREAIPESRLKYRVVSSARFRPSRLALGSLDP